MFSQQQKVNRIESKRKMNLLMETNYNKCGEIYTSLELNKRLYALKCLFCETSHISLIEFIEHIEQSHMGTLTKSTIHMLTKTETHELLKTSSNFTNNNYEHDGNANLELKKENSTIDFENKDDPLIETALCVKPLRISSSKYEEVLLEDENILQMEFNNENDDDEWSNENKSNFDNSEDHDNEVIDNAIDTKTDSNLEFDLALITGYEHLPLLWDKHDALYKDRKKREAALKSLTAEMNKQFQKRLHWKMINSRLKILRSNFRKELRQKQTAQFNSEHFKPSNNFTKLCFLKNNIQLRNNESNSAIVNKTKSKILYKAEDIEQLIEIYESFPCLWNTKHSEHQLKRCRVKALNEMRTVIEEKLKIKITIDMLKKKLSRIRLVAFKENLRQHKCENLGKPFKPTYKFYTKINFLLTNIGPYKCSHCDEIFKTEDKLQVHISSHDGSVPFACPICNKGSSSAGNRNAHMLRHKQDFQYKCKDCGKGYVHAHELNAHSRQHTGEKPFFCETCGKSFRTRSYFVRHQRRHEKRPSHFCELCNKGFYEKSKLKEHMNAHLNVRDKVCNVCGKSFTSLKFLLQHKLIHAEKKKYVCNICGKKFAQNAGLYGHMKLHKLKPFDSEKLKPSK